MTTVTTPTDVPKAVKLFGREPAAWTGLIEAALFLIVAILVQSQSDFDGAGFVVVAMGLVSAGFGAFTAIATKDTALGWIVGLGKAAINLLLFFGFDLDPTMQASILGFLAVFAGFMQRDRTSPIVAPVDPSPVQVTPSPVNVDPAAVAQAVDWNLGADKAEGNDTSGYAEEPYEEDLYVGESETLTGDGHPQPVREDEPPRA